MLSNAMKRENDLTKQNTNFAGKWKIWKVWNGESHTHWYIETNVGNRSSLGGLRGGSIEGIKVGIQMCIFVRMYSYVCM